MIGDVLRMLVMAMTAVVAVVPVLLLLAMLPVLVLVPLMMVTAAMVAETEWPSRCSCEIIRLVPLGSSNGGTRLPEVTEIAS